MEEAATSVFDGVCIQVEAVEADHIVTDDGWAVMSMIVGAMLDSHHSIYMIRLLLLSNRDDTVCCLILL